MNNETVDPVEQKVEQDLLRQRHLLLRLAENALTVAENLRDNYFRNTTRFVAHLRRSVYGQSTKSEPVMKAEKADSLRWDDIKGEKVTFIDGGVGRVELASQIPILLRVGSYTVRPGEHHFAEREHFAYYPILLGDLEGGSKDSRDFPDIVRIIAELLGGLSVLERNKDLGVLMFHGPLMYLMNAYSASGHTPFTEKDIDLLLDNYGPDPRSAKSLKEDFLRDAHEKIYPRMLEAHWEWSDRRLFEPLAWIAFLYRQLLAKAHTRNPSPVIAGVVERGGNLREFSRNILERVFDGLRKKGNENYFDEMYGRSDLRSPESLLDRLGYTDALLAAMLLKVGDRTEDWQIKKFNNLRKITMRQLLPGEIRDGQVDYAPLKSKEWGFPHVSGCYVHVSETVEPIRVEFFSELHQEDAAAQRAYLYARLLPQYGFPVGLDIADKYAKVPAWMTNAYTKLIQHHLGVGLQSGQISDKDMRKIIMQAIYMGQRDWPFRPKI